MTLLFTTEKKDDKNVFWRALDHSQNNCEVLTQWEFVALGQTLTYTTSNFNNLRNWLEIKQYIDGNMCNYKNQHPHHDLAKTCGARKCVCPVYIRPTDNLKSHPRKSFRINERWYNKYDIHKSTIDKKCFNEELEGTFRSSK